MKKKKTVLIIVLVVLLAAAGVVVAPKLLNQQEPTAAAQGSYTVGRGNVEVTITGNGMLEAQDETDILLPEGVKIDTIFVEKGDVVAAGDVLAVFDSTSLQNRAAELSAQLSSLDKQLGTRKVTGTITAPVEGRIKYLPAAKDDDVIDVVNQYGCLAILSTDGLMQVELKTSHPLTLNAEVTVKWNGGSTDGKVASRIDGGYLITLEDDEAPYLGSADVHNDTTPLGSGILEIHAPLAVFGNGGTIEKVHVKLDSEVYASNTLFTLDNEPATDAYRQVLADRNEKAEQLQKILMYQKTPNIVAECDGTIRMIAVEEGKKTVSTDGSGDMKAFEMGIGGASKMTVDVDELDVSRVKLCQKATITLDAFSSESFAATVDRISHIGEASGSITTYATDLTLDADLRLMEGMNGSAVIVADRAQDVLIIPLGAIHEDADGSYVYLLDALGGQTKAYVQTGLSDATYAEVVNGLNEGDRIAYTQSNGNAFSNFMNGQMEMMSQMGGMGK